jgi:imidazolonepropionase-like amidohydrolase
MLGVITIGAFADILLVNGDPLEDITVCGASGANFPVIVKGGKFYKNELRAER